MYCPFSFHFLSLYPFITCLLGRLLLKIFCVVVSVCYLNLLPILMRGVFLFIIDSHIYVIVSFTFVSFLLLFVYSLLDHIYLISFIGYSSTLISLSLSLFLFYIIFLSLSPLSSSSPSLFLFSDSHSVLSLLIQNLLSQFGNAFLNEGSSLESLSSLSSPPSPPVAEEGLIKFLYQEDMLLLLATIYHISMQVYFILTQLLSLLFLFLPLTFSLFLYSK